MKKLAEFVGIAVAIALLTALMEFDPMVVADWRAWAVGIGASAVRAAAKAALAFIASSHDG